MRFIPGLLASTALACLLLACGVETAPNPDFQAGTGAGASGGSGGSGGSDAGDAGGEGGTTGGTGGMTGGVGGTTGGSGGTGGDAAIPEDCDNDNECPATRPQCNAAGRCAVCTSSAACEDRDGLKLCELATSSTKRGECVACLEDDDCDGNEDGEYCNNNTCVPCKTNADCDDLSKPECGADGQCTGCTSAEACDGRNGTEVCVTAPGPTRGHCVGCVEHADCSNPTPQCTDNECKPCTNGDACEDRENATVCDTSDHETFGGTCVECTGSSFESCGSAGGGAAYVCEVVTRACSTETQGSALACEPCIADAHCRPGTLCMQTKFGAADTGSFCLWRQDATGAGAPNGDCGDVRPYIGTEDEWQSIEGTEPTVCKPSVTTCQGQTDFRSKMCSGPTADGHAQCGASGISDAYCAPFNSGHRCTVPCVAYDDCQDTRPGEDTDTECETQTLGAVDVKVCQFE